MPLLTADIMTILEAESLITFASDVASGTRLIDTGLGDQVVDCNYANVDLTASMATNTITVTREANDSATNNGVNIRTHRCVSHDRVNHTPPVCLHRRFFRLRVLSL